MIPRAPVPLAPLLLVSAGAVGFEIALTRYFAIASWSEYGYWVISITMAGFAVSGVVLSLFKEFFARRADALLAATPAILLVAATAGFWLATVNPFNPLELQNPDVWFDQLLNIWKYYAALFPFYFATGLYIGLYFLRYQEDIPKIYAVDLAGAGAGALAVLMLMFFVHPFHLSAALLPLFVVAALMSRHEPGTHYRARTVAVTVVLFVVCEIALLALTRADFNEYKSIVPPLHVEGGRTVQEVRTPRGHFVVLDNFTERLDTDFSNNAKSLGAVAPPRTLGIYRDGNRIGSLARPGEYDLSYTRALLDGMPYALRPEANALLVGSRGGFRVREALTLGATAITALEPDPTVFGLLQATPRGLVAASLSDGRVRVLPTAPAAFAADSAAVFDVVDIASDFLDQSDPNRFAFTVEAIQDYYRILRADGVISVPVSIREFTVYALKTVETVRVALVGLGVHNPQDHIIVYRSSWNARILVGRRAFSPAEVAQVKAFADRRSFDVSVYPGIAPGRTGIWNDLPLVSFETETVVSDTEHAADAVTDEALKLFSPEGPDFRSNHFFNLEPSTYDRPFFHSVLRLPSLRAILAKIALIPREEIGLLINIAVLLQAALIAVAILGLPLIRWRHARPGARSLLKAILYFAGLGLGFLFVEIYLIEKAAFFLNDRTYAFAVVLAGMLVFSGCGSYLAGRYLARPARGLAWSCAVVLTWLVLALFLLDPALLAMLGWSAPAKWAVLLAIIAPVSIALGMPFPLGLYLFRGDHAHFLPWAWSLNGAFSVIATPLANIAAVTSGFRSLLIVAIVLYVVVLVSYPAARGTNRIG